MTRRDVIFGVLLVAAGYGVGWAQSQQSKIEQVGKDYGHSRWSTDRNGTVPGNYSRDD